MPGYKVALRRRWFGEELEETLAELDHPPAAGELLALAGERRLGEGATLHVTPPKGKGQRREYRVRDLLAASGRSP